MLKNDGIVISEMGVETLITAAEVFQQPKHNFYNNLFSLSLSGIRKDGVSVITFSTPASSFFVPIVESRGKSLKTFITGGRLMPYAGLMCQESDTKSEKNSKHGLTNPLTWGILSTGFRRPELQAEQSHETGMILKNVTITDFKSLSVRRKPTRLVACLLTPTGSFFVRRLEAAEKGTNKKPYYKEVCR